MKHASLLLVATVVVLTAPSAFAQNIASRNPTASPSFDVPPSWRAAPDDRRTCLYNKVSSKKECHTRDGWRRIAKKLGKQQPAADPAPH